MTARQARGGRSALRAGTRRLPLREPGKGPIPLLRSACQILVSNLENDEEVEDLWARRAMEPERQRLEGQVDEQ